MDVELRVQRPLQAEPDTEGVQRVRRTVVRQRDAQAVLLTGGAQRVGDEPADAVVARLERLLEVRVAAAAGGELSLQRGPVGVADAGVGPPVEGVEGLLY